jgi:hypothetical protein
MMMQTILTHGDRVLIPDPRISVPFQTNWDLYIANVNSRDEGRYACKVNTVPAIAKYVTVYVLGKADV